MKLGRALDYTIFNNLNKNFPKRLLSSVLREKKFGFKEWVFLEIFFKHDDFTGSDQMR